MSYVHICGFLDTSVALTCDVCLPVRAVEEYGCAEALQQEESRVVAEGHGAGGGHGDEDGAEAVAAVVKKLPERALRAGAAGLLAVDGVQRLVREQAKGAGERGPRRSLCKKKRSTFNFFAF